MGVVQREGDWRLEKQKDGVYEVTHRKSPQLKIITSDYTPEGLMDERNDFSVQVQEVNDFSDAERIFSEMARSDQSFVGLPTQPFGGGSEPLDADLEIGDGDGDLSNLPPGGFLLLGYVAGGFLIVQSGLVIDSPLFIVGALFILLGIVMSGLTYRVYAADGVRAALDFLLSTPEEESETADSSGDSDVEKSPPAPESLKNELYFERADRKCEWCGIDIDSPDVHHIKPREEGGPNDPENLIVLCPNDHRKADRGAISRSKLRYKVASQMENWEYSKQ